MASLSLVYPRCSERAAMVVASNRLCRVAFELRGAVIREGYPLDGEALRAALLRADRAVTDLGVLLHGDEQGADA